MAETKEYKIKVQGILVDVTKEIYLAYKSSAIGKIEFSPN